MKIFVSCYALKLSIETFLKNIISHKLWITVKTSVKIHNIAFMSTTAY